MKFISLTLLIFINTLVFAQHKIKVIDSETNEPVPGVLIEILTKQDKRVEAMVTNFEGNAVFSIKGDYKLRASHVSYLTVNKKLADGEQTISIEPNTTTLGDVVITGQYNAQSADKSVYQVKTVSAKTIENQGSIQLNEVLAKQLNIRITPDLAIGNNSMSLQGIPGKNVKILIDGVPLVNRNGNGNDADLSQINMANIERVEIVEGPMSVNYGANALAGVVNLITKKPKKNSYQIGLDYQGETIDDKYSLTDGNTNINLTSGFSLPLSFLLSLNGGVTRFGGYHGRYNDRQYEWNPKDQAFYDIRLGYKTDLINISYKFEQLSETIVDSGPLQEDVHFATGTVREFGNDSDYISKRLGHQLQLDGKFSSNYRYNVLVSYSDFVRTVENYTLWFDTDQKNVYASDTTSFSAFLSRGTVQSINPSKAINYQVGYDINFESTQGGRILDNEIQKINDYAGFLSLEWAVNPKLLIRPGFRGSYNSSFGGWVTPSLNIKYSLNTNYYILAAYGNGYRAPSLRELYYEFVDTNHTVIGNEDLTPEHSDHFSLGLNNYWNIRNTKIKSELSIFYNIVHDLINFQFDPDDATYAKYFNLNKLETVGFNINERYEAKNLNLGVGFGLIGRREEDSSVDLPNDFFFSPEVSMDFNFREPKTKLNFNLFYKYNGPTNQYLFDENDELLIGEVDGYNLLDATINRRFLKYLTLSIGAKNIFDVKALNSTAQSASGIHTGSSQVSIGYGRSYFFRVAFNLNSLNNN